MATGEAGKPKPSSCPPYPEMILAAIKGLGDDKNGSNKSTISKYIQSKYVGLPPAHMLMLTAHLQRMRRCGELIFLKNNYFRADAPNAPPRRRRGRPPRANKDPLEAALKQATAGMPDDASGRPPKKAKTEDGASPASAPPPPPPLPVTAPPPSSAAAADPSRKKQSCVAVDGSSSYIPGQAQFVEDAIGDEEGEDTDVDGFDNNPMSTSSPKRGSSTTDTTTSPANKSMAHLLNLLHGLIQELKDANHQFRSNKAIKEKQEKEEVDQQIDRCLRMAVECGATEESEEYFMATTLFEKEYNRKIFCKFTTAEGRFMWLKRWCQHSCG